MKVNQRLRRTVLTHGAKVLGLSATLKALRVCAGLSPLPLQAALIFATRTGGTSVIETNVARCRCLNGQQEAELLLLQL